MNLTDSQLRLIVQVVHEDRLKMLRAKFESDHKISAANREEGTNTVRLPLTVFRFDKSEQSAT